MFVRLFSSPNSYNARLMVFVVILALSTLGTSFASAILAKDSTTNDQNELVSKETGEALATQTTAKVIVIDEEFDQEMTRQRKLACSTTKSQGNIDSAACNYDDLSNISTEDGEMMARLCNQGVTVHTVKTDANGDLVETPLCPIAGTDTVNWGPADSWIRYRGTDYPSQMTISHANNGQTALMPQTSIGGTDHYSLETAFIGGQTEVVLLCNEGDEPVCGSDGTRYDCAAVAGGATLATVTQCACGGVGGKNPADECMEMSCPDQPVCLPESCWNGVENGSCECCPTPTSQSNCLLGYTFNAGSSVCDTPVSTSACAPPEPAKCDSPSICNAMVKYCTDGAGGSYSVSPDGCNGCVYPACCDGSEHVDNDPF